MKSRYVITLRKKKRTLYWYEQRRRWLRDGSGATLYASHIGMEQDIRNLKKKYKGAYEHIGFSPAEWAGVNYDRHTGARFEPALPLPKSPSARVLILELQEEVSELKGRCNTLETDMRYNEERLRALENRVG